MRLIHKLRRLKTLSQKDYGDLVQTIEIVAKRDPLYYRRQLLWLACLGYAYIAFTFALINLGLWALWQLHTLIPLLAVVSSEIIALTLLVALYFFSKLLLPFAAPQGVSIRRQNAPALFAMLDRVARSLKAPRPHRVIIQDNINAAVLQQPFLGFIGWHTNYLLIGLPLMQALSPQQFEAVMAHEFAHLRGGDSKFGAWIYRIRMYWSDVSDELSRGRSNNFLLGRFFRWYGPFFKAYSFVHARAQEYEADRWAGEVVSAKAQGEALVWLDIASSFAGEIFWAELFKGAQDAQDPPVDVMTQQLSALERHEVKGWMDSAVNDAADDSEKAALRQRQCWVALSLQQPTNNRSTHPCLSDRLAALNYRVDDSLVPAAEKATILLGDALEHCTQKLNKLWLKNYGASWQRLYSRNQVMKQRLQALCEKPLSEKTVEEKVKQARLTHSFQGAQEAIDLLRTAIKEAPNHAIARYWLGRLMLENGEPAIAKESIDNLLFAIDNEPSVVASAAYEIYAERFRQGITDFDESQHRRWLAQASNWAKAKRSRHRLDKRTAFVPHALLDCEIAQIRDYFSGYSEIKAVYIARKVVERFPEVPCYVIAIDYQFPRNAKELPISSDRLLEFIDDTLAFSADYTLQLLTAAPPFRKIKQVENALIYHQDLPTRSIAR